MRALTHALEQQRLHHAYLFTGTRGVGKTTIARILAKALNCDTGITATPCGICSACTEIDAGRFIDLLEVDAATNTRVDEMRQLLENAVYAPTRGRFKVYVIDEVHMLSNSAFNAMLKTLEEPPEHVKFILATTDPQKIPATVLSRCLQFNLKQMPPTAICGHLEHILGAEAIPFEATALPVIAQAAHGSMRDALSLLDQAIAYGAGQLAEAQVRAMLGTIDQGYLFDILDALAAGDLTRAMGVAYQLQDRSLSFENALEDLATLLHRVALSQAAADILPESTPDRGRIVELAGRIDRESVQLLYQIALIGRRDLPLAPDEFAGFSMTLIRMHAFAPVSADSLTAGARSPAPAPVQPAATARATAATAPAPSSEPAPTAARAPVSANAPEAAVVTLPTPEDWPQRVRSLTLSGFARQLAEQSELSRIDGQRLYLRIPSSARALASYRDRLRSSIEQQWGMRCMIEIEIAEVATRSVAGENARQREDAQAQAQATMDADPFVADLVNQFGATIESIAPRAEDPSQPSKDH